MLGFRKAKPVAEHEAEGEIERIFHEIRQVLRVSGVNLNFRTWAAFDKFLPALWDALRPNLDTRAFEESADRLRAEAVTAAAAMPRLGVTTEGLGESQRFQIQAALDLYHYINPKLLLFTAAARMALDGERVGGGGASPLERIELGEPSGMFPMEMAPEEPADDALRALFEEIKATLGLATINSDYRTLALWPEHLAAAWVKLKPRIVQSAYNEAANALRESARSLARALPLRFEFPRERVTKLGEDADAVVEKTRKFEQLLPPLILNIALLHLDWKSAETLIQSPFPARSRQEARR